MALNKPANPARIAVSVEAFIAHHPRIESIPLNFELYRALI
jgi:hypothetical protein